MQDSICIASTSHLFPLREFIRISVCNYDIIIHEEKIAIGSYT